MMTRETEVNDSNVSEPAKKEWHRPRLRKLPIAATAHDVNNSGNDGNFGKQGKAGGSS
jgi:hypothetical protein